MVAYLVFLEAQPQTLEEGTLALSKAISVPGITDSMQEFSHFPSHSKSNSFSHCSIIPLNVQNILSTFSLKIYNRQTKRILLTLLFCQTLKTHTQALFLHSRSLLPSPSHP